MRNYVPNAIANALMLVAMIPLVTMGYFILKVTDERYFPPIIDIRAVEYELTDTDIKVHVIGRKVRDCKRLSVQGWYRDVYGNNVPMKVTGVNPQQHHAMGPTDFGWWTLIPRPEGGLFWVSATHRCNPLYDQETVLGPFTYQEFSNKK